MSERRGDPYLHLQRGASGLSLVGDVMDEEAVAAPKGPRYPPTWLIPQTVEGIGSSLADTVRRVTRCPAAVVVRDPATETASVVAVSAGRRPDDEAAHVRPGGLDVFEVHAVVAD